MASLLNTIRSRFYYPDGRPLSGGKVYTYEAGTLVPKATFSDAALTIQNANPVLLDSAGGADIFVSGNYKVRTFDANDMLIESVDGVSDYVQPAVDNLIGQLAGDNGGTLVHQKAPFAGAVNRTMADRSADTISIKDFGSIADGTYHPLSERYATLALAQFAYANISVTSLSQSIDWAATCAAFKAAAGRSVFAPLGSYVITDTIPIFDAQGLYGDGYYGDNNTDNQQVQQLSGTVFLAYGTGAKTLYCRGVTDERTSGGAIINPDPQAGFGGLDNTYSLASYYNSDASGGAAATAKAFSALFYLPYATAGFFMRDVKLLPYFGAGGIAGYKNKTLSLGDDWDVGIYMDNARYCRFDNVTVYGYWRLNGLLIRSGMLAHELGSIYSGAEENKFYNCYFQGWKSVGIRGIGMWKCTAVTSTYIEIPWADNHPFNIAIDPRITRGEFSVLNISVSGMSKVGDKLRFATVSSQVGNVSVGQEILPAYVGNGVAGMVFEYCRFHGLSHASGRRISDPAVIGALPPSACVEVSGARLRGIRFEGSKAQTVDDIAFHLHQCIDVILGPNARFEGTPPSANASGGGVRMLSTPTNAVLYPYLCRGAFRVQLHAEQPAADFTPAFGSIPSKFATGGLWNPQIFGQIHHGPISIGGAESFRFIKEYIDSGFTPVVSFATDGDLVVSNQVRAGTVEVLGDWVRFSISLTCKLTFTTASGSLGVSLPYISNNQADLFFTAACSYAGLNLPAGRTQVTAVIAANTQYMNFEAAGSGVAPALITASNCTSGAFITVKVSGSYRRAGA